MIDIGIDIIIYMIDKFYMIGREGDRGRELLSYTMIEVLGDDRSSPR